MLENTVGKNVLHSVGPLERQSQECGRANIKKMLGMHELDEGGVRAADGCAWGGWGGCAGATGSSLPLPRGDSDSMKPRSSARQTNSACPTPAAHRRLC